MKNDFNEIDSSYIYSLCHKKHKNKEQTTSAVCEWNPNKHDGQPCPTHTEIAKQIGEAGRAVSSIGNEVSKIGSEKKSSKVYEKYETLNDKELRDKVNRLRAEHELSDLEGKTKYVESGKEKARETLQTVGAVLGIMEGTVMVIGATTAAVTGLIKSIKKIKHSDIDDEYLMHYGVKGQKWGIRKYQNEDGTLTPEGLEKYGSVENLEKVQAEKKKKAKIAAGVTAGVVVAAGAAALISLGIITNKEVKNIQKSPDSISDDLKKTLGAIKRRGTRTIRPQVITPKVKPNFGTVKDVVKDAVFTKPSTALVTRPNWDFVR